MRNIDYMVEMYEGILSASKDRAKRGFSLLAEEIIQEETQKKLDELRWLMKVRLSEKT